MQMMFYFTGRLKIESVEQSGKYAYFVSLAFMSDGFFLGRFLTLNALVQYKTLVLFPKSEHCDTDNIKICAIS